MEDSIQELADAIYREKVLRARNASGTDKMSDGPKLFLDACERMRLGIRSDFPGAAAEEIEEKLRQQLNRLTRLHEHDLYQKASR